jgi:hypothetical protein
VRGEFPHIHPLILSSSLMMLTTPL